MQKASGYFGEGKLVLVSVTTLHAWLGLRVCCRDICCELNHKKLFTVCHVSIYCFGCRNRHSRSPNDCGTIAPTETQLQIHVSSNLRCDWFTN